MIDIKSIADAARRSSDALLAKWLPSGKRDGHEWVALNPKRSDRSPGSFRVNLSTGAWADFALEGARGGDLVSLYAYLHDLDQGAAAKAVAAEIGIAIDPPVSPSPAKRSNQVWEAIVPAEDAPTFRLTHRHYGSPSMVWAYQNAGGHLIGYVCRFDKPDGTKEILPAVWARNDIGERAWRWLSFPKPRPLYGLPDLAARSDAQVLIVEGEKTCEAARVLLPQMVVVTWPGGSKAVGKTDWRPLQGRDVIIWPDHDDAGLGAAQAIAMQIGALARRVRTVHPPEDKPSGWDLADLEPSAASAEWARNYLREHLAAAEKKTPSAEISEPDAGWKRRILRTEGGMALPTRHNVYTVLRHHPDVAGMLGYDDFAQRIVRMRETPWGAPAGEEWTASDDFQLGMWLAHGSGLRIIIGADEPIASAVSAAALENRFHPVRAYLGRLDGAWDGTPRCAHWLEDCLGVRQSEYSALVGTFFLLNLVRRVFEPGCIMRSVPVLEGAQNRGKSTALRKLTEPWFADSHLDLNNKDSMHALRGVWLYEIAEFDSFNKVEVTRAKAFISSTSDHYRPPYEKRFVSVPRQTTFAATVNGSEYLKDSTGNTRFWPLETGDINLTRMEEQRDQLWAEAMHRYHNREPSHPTWAQEQTLFRPEQERREVMDPWWSLIATFLGNRTRVTMTQIFVDCLDIEPSRMDNAKQMSMRIGVALARAGWIKKREPGGSREYYYVPGVGAQPAQLDAAAVRSEGDDVPF